MKEYTLGIDIAKPTFEVALLRDDRLRHHSFANNSRGFAELDNWLTKGKAASLHACMEATGRYWEGLADHLYQAGHQVSVVNPAQVKAFGQSRLLRTKTDRSDAALIASFCRSSDPRPWTPPPAEQRELQELTRRLHSLKQMHLMESNRLKAGGGSSPAVKASLQESLAFLDGQIEAFQRQVKAHLAAHADLKQGEKLLTSISALAA
jgi:transposase